MTNDDKELLKYYGEQIEEIKNINSSLRRDNGILICLVITLSILLATGTGRICQDVFMNYIN